MDFSKLQYSMENNVSMKLKGIINYDVIYPVMSKLMESNGDFLGNSLKGTSLWLNKDIAPKIYDLCYDVKKKLGFDENIEFYISNNSTTNAFSVIGENTVKHKISFFSGIIEKMSDDELRFVIGHEIGHLMFRHSDLDRAIQFAYPNFQSLPEFVRINYLKWKQLCEISSDRIGLLSVENKQSAYSALFRLYVGVGNEYINFNEETFDKLIDNIIENHLTGSIDYTYTHPPIPVRVKAMKMFADSELFSNAKEKKGGSSIEEFQKNLDSMIVKMFRYPLSDFEGAYVDYMLSAGIIVIYADNQVHTNEIRTFYDMLSRFIDLDFIDPSAFGQATEKNKDMLRKAADFIIKKYPERIPSLLMDVIFLAMNDREFNESELNAILMIGIEYFGMKKDEVMELIRQGMMRYYSPYRI